VSNRFSRVERNSRSAATGFLSSLGICFGVMALIVTLSVMNGFQRSYIDSIMEISSSHIRYTAAEEAPREALDAIAESLLKEQSVAAAYPFMEAQTLMVGISKLTGHSLNRQVAALIRAVPRGITRIDSGFSREVKMYRGSFDLNESSSIVLGNLLAQSLGVSVGDKVNLLALSGGSDVDLISSNRQFVVTGIFSSGYADINSTFAFISFEDGIAHLGASAPRLLSIKLKNPDKAEMLMQKFAGKIPHGSWESWQHYNRAFFGALRIEKNILFLLVFIIFVVVGVNIYNGMRRMVFERRAEIAVFSALGAKKDAIQAIFILRGFLTGFFGAIPGLVLGLLICVRMDSVFMLIASFQYYAELFFVQLLNPQYAQFLRSNSMYYVYASIPARIFPFEALFTTMFGFLSAVFASWAASKSMLSLSIAEVLRDE
jgi:lipoprotein-releasing system permease protein